MSSSFSILAPSPNRREPSSVSFAGHQAAKGQSAPYKGLHASPTRRVGLHTHICHILVLDTSACCRPCPAFSSLASWAGRRAAAAAAAAASRVCWSCRRCQLTLARYHRTRSMVHSSPVSVSPPATVVDETYPRAAPLGYLTLVQPNTNGCLRVHLQSLGTPTHERPKTAYIEPSPRTAHLASVRVARALALPRHSITVS